MTTSVLNINLANNIAQIVPEYTQEEVTAILAETKTETDPPLALIGIAVTLVIAVVVALLLKKRLHRP